MVQGEADIAKVGVRDVLELRQLASGPDAHHRAPGVELAVGGFNGFGGMRGAERHVDGRKNSAGQRQKMRGENHAVFGQAGVLENFRGVAMREKVIGLEIFVDFNEMEVATGIFAGATGSGLAIAHNAAAGCDEASIGERPQGENDAGGIAAGVGEEAGLGNFRGIKLREAINGFTEPIGVRRGKLVPGGEGFGGAKAKSAAEIDDAETHLEESRCDFRGNFVRGGEKRGAGAAGFDLRNGEGAEGRFATAAELGKQFREALLAVGVAHVEGGRLDRGMTDEKARQLEAGVARYTHHSDVFGGSHFTSDSIFFCRDSRDLRSGVMIRTVSSPAMVPAVSGNLAASTEAASACAPPGGVFKTSKFSAGRTSRRNSPRARERAGRPLDSSGSAAVDL